MAHAPQPGSRSGSALLAAPGPAPEVVRLGEPATSPTRDEQADRRARGAQLALLTTLVSWSGAFVAIRVGLEHLSGVQLTVLRLGVASIAFAVVCLVRGKFPRIPRRQWGWMVLAGATGMAAYQLLINVGEQTVSAGTAAILVNVGPLFTVAGAALLLGERITGRVAVGGAVALLGSVIVAVGAGGGLGFEPGTVLILGAALSSAVYFLVLTRLTQHCSPLDVTAVATWVGALLVAPLAAVDPPPMASLPASTWVAVLFLGVVASTVGFLSWTVALSRLPAGTTSLSLYVVPAITVVIGLVVLGEAPTGLELLGGATALVGVAILRTRTARRTPSAVGRTRPRVGRARSGTGSMTCGAT